MNKDSENLKELLSDFLEEKAADRACQEILSADKLFAEFSSPSIDEQTIAAIKQQVSDKLKARQNRAFKSLALKISAAAAMILIAVSIVIKLQTKTTGISNSNTAVIASNIWTEDADEDYKYSILADEVRDIESTMNDIRLDEHDNANGLRLMNLEMELIAVNNDFWKG